MEKLWTVDTIFWWYVDELSKLEDIIIWIRTTIDPVKSEEIFSFYNEIKYHNYNSEVINYNLCFNKISLIIERLNIYWIDNNSMEYFYRFKCFISSNLTNEEKEKVIDKVENIIYL